MRNTGMRTAVLVDGAFFIKRYRFLICDSARQGAEQVVDSLITWALLHLEAPGRGRKKAGAAWQQRELYRIFFYDCPPLLNRRQHPITRQVIDFSQTREAEFRKLLHRRLKRRRKVALRLGRLADRAAWSIKPGPTERLLAQTLTAADLAASDVAYDVTQKGVDMRIGLDIASLAFKRQVDQIVLIAGDADFVPAAKLARREGIDFVLDPMWKAIPEDLHEHIDGLRSTCPHPTSAARASDPERTNP